MSFHLRGKYKSKLYKHTVPYHELKELHSCYNFARYSKKLSPKGYPDWHLNPNCWSQQIRLWIVQRHIRPIKYFQSGS